MGIQLFHWRWCSGSRSGAFSLDNVSWLLRDEFTDTRAAGAVDATPATPGPGTRAATDTDSKMTIGSDVLNVAPPVEPPPVPEVLYQVRVLSHLKYWNIRAHPANPAWAAKDMGDAYGGLELCVFEEQELDGYTWLRCGGDNFWLRSDGVERI